MTEKTTQYKSLPLSLQRILYAGFLIMCCYYLYRGETVTAGSNLGIGLIFDPFNGIEWQQRKGWQKAWLVVHLVLTLVLLIAGLLLKG